MEEVVTISSSPLEARVVEISDSPLGSLFEKIVRFSYNGGGDGGGSGGGCTGSTGAATGAATGTATGTTPTKPKSKPRKISAGKIKRKPKQKGPTTLNERMVALHGCKEKLDSDHESEVEAEKDDSFEMAKLLSGKPTKLRNMKKTLRAQKIAQSSKNKHVKKQKQSSIPVDLLLSPEAGCKRVQELKLIFPSTPPECRKNIHKRRESESSSKRRYYLSDYINKDGKPQETTLSLFEFASKLPSDFDIDDAQILHSGQLESEKENIDIEGDTEIEDNTFEGSILQSRSTRDSLSSIHVYEISDSESDPTFNSILSSEPLISASQDNCKNVSSQSNSYTVSDSQTSNSILSRPSNTFETQSFSNAIDIYEISDSEPENNHPSKSTPRPYIFNISSARRTEEINRIFDFDDDIDEIPQSPGHSDNDLSSYLPYIMTTEDVLSPTQPTPQPDYEKMSTDELRKQIANFGFKPKRSRKAMIELLEGCHSTQPPSIIPITSTTTTTTATTTAKLFSRISNHIKTAQTSKPWWTKILTYEPLPIEHFHEFLKSDLSIDIDISLVKSWCDSKGVCFTSAS